MKIFGFEFRKFEEDNTIIEAIETWCVKWISLTVRSPWTQEKGSGLGVDIQVQAFPTKESADLYAKELRDAIKLLGHRGYTVEVYKQNTPTNKR